MNDPTTAVGDRHGRVLVQPWTLDHDEYVRHAVDARGGSTPRTTPPLRALASGRTDPADHTAAPDPPRD